ncbi:phasin family protein [Sphaerotilus montanus]|jgi:phasin family protein|uniref:Phasin family protein n=2 Tax=Sphaerotilus montanus TaxID=522889 RepID=A0A7Y9R287_9BURK|nr:phasin family protein [Sphaerotilus montanus]
MLHRSMTACNPGRTLYTGNNAAVQQSRVHRHPLSTKGLLTMINADQFAAAAQSNLDTAVALGQKAFGGVEKLVELNLQTARAALDESAANAKALLSVKDAQGLAALQSSVLQPAAEKATAYSRQVYEIAAATQADISKLFEGQVSASQQSVQGFVEAALKNAPAGSESAVAFMKQAMTASSTAMESAQKAAKQAVSAAEANIQSMTKVVSKAA